MSNQSARQASARAITGTALTYEGDFHALFDSLAIPAGTYNERLLAFINARLSSSYTNLPSAQAAYAASKGVATWNDVTSVAP